MLTAHEETFEKCQDRLIEEGFVYQDDGVWVDEKPFPPEFIGEEEKYRGAALIVRLNVPLAVDEYMIVYSNKMNLNY